MAMSNLGQTVVFRQGLLVAFPYIIQCFDVWNIWILDV